MEINAIVSLLLSHQFAEARTLWRSIKGENKHPAMRGIGVYFHLKDKKYEEALNLLSGEEDMFSIFLRSQILLADKKPLEALVNLVQNYQSSLVACAGYTNLLVKSAIQFELGLDNMQKIIDTITSASMTTIDSSVVLNLSKYLEMNDKRDIAVNLLKESLKVSRDKMIQARYLTLLADVDFQSADQL